MDSDECFSANFPRGRITLSSDQAGRNSSQVVYWVVRPQMCNCEFIDCTNRTKGFMHENNCGMEISCMKMKKKYSCRKNEISGMDFIMQRFIHM